MKIELILFWFLIPFLELTHLMIHLDYLLRSFSDLRFTETIFFETNTYDDFKYEIKEVKMNQMKKKQYYLFQNQI